MNSSATPLSRPIALNASVQAKTYGLFAVAMALTVVGVFVGMLFARTLLSTGFHVVLAIIELAIIFTSRWWVERSPLNYALFGAFPLLSGITVTPYLLLLLAGYENGAAIIFNAALTTVFMALAAAVVARSVKADLSVFARGLIIALIGLLVLSLVQFFVPGLRTQTMELLLSGAGIVIFAGFTAVDLQRIARLGRTGMNPFLLALSLYLDIFNLFLMILRFMTALSGERR